MAHKITKTDSLSCLHCGAENPLKAYCCLSCFKVLRPKEKIPWYRMYIRPSTPFGFIVLLALLAGVVFFKHWIDNLEAQVTMNIKGDDYNVSVIADKKKRNALFDVQSPSEEPPQQE
jgi:ribosomal protein L40E